MVKFDTSREEFDAIIRICERAELMGYASIRDRMNNVMDLSAVHANGNPMDFAAMLAADTFNFVHDFGGITRHINRRSGKLMDHFSPRFSKRDPAAA